ncbi:MAG: hypothetical protein ACFFBD_04295 [Candidatus Hodarchaeota archaeon]
MLSILNKLLELPNIDILEAVKLACQCLRDKGNRQDLVILEKDFPTALSSKIETFKEAIKFVIYRRTLE